MSRSVRRIGMAALTAIISLSCGRSHQATYEPLYRAGRAIEGAISVGVSYVEFGNLLRTFSTELLIATDKAKSKADKDMVAAYGDLLLTYKESATLWKAQIDSSKYEWLRGRIPVNAEIGPIVAKYNLTTTSVSPSFSDSNVTTISGDSMQRLWEVASEKSKKAVSLYFASD